MSSYNNIIKKMPNQIKKLYYDLVPFDKRYGYEFTKAYNFLMQSKEWDTSKLLEYQNNELMKLLEHSYNNVPYYKNLFDSHDIKLKSIQNTTDLKAIPILTKDIIRNNLKNLKAKNLLNEKVYEFKTSGSTGNKLIFYGMDDIYKKEAAFILRAYKMHGATLYDKPSVWLRRFVPKTEKDQLWYYDYELKRLYMSAYHMNPDTIKNYIDEINSKNYHTLVAYPSSAYILACLCEEQNLKLTTIKKIHVTSETMLDQWREKIKQVFNITPVAHYGAIEKVSFMHQLEDSTKYYNNLEYGVTEFIENNNEHEIVATGFLNYYMPFIRYKTEDTVQINKNLESCTLPDSILNVYGRTSDILISKNNSRLPGVNFYSWIDKSVSGVKMFQIIQKSRENIVFNFVTSDKYTDNTINDIKSGLTARLGDLNFEINKVSEIKRNDNSGKIRCIINLIQD